jgi:transcription-repair coupling factor (superfamily II helicase)
MLKLLQPPVPGSTNQTLHWGPVPRSAWALAIVQAAKTCGAPTVVVCADSQGAQFLLADLSAFAGEQLPVQLMPDWETLPYDLFAPHPDIVSQRLRLLAGLGQARRGIIVVPVATLMQRLAPQTWVRGFGLDLSVGQHLDLQAERLRLEQSGYRCVPQVTEHGEFAVRGALLDLFPMGSARPYRIELFDDEVESIRSFDPETQLSIKKTQGIELLPAREFPFDDQAIKSFRNAFRNRFEGDLRQCTLYQDARNGLAGAGIEYYLPLFFEGTETLFDYLPEDTLFVLEDGARKTAKTFWTQLQERYEQRRYDIQHPILSPQELFVHPEQCMAQVAASRLIESASKSKTEYRFDAKPAPDVPLRADSEDGESALKKHLNKARDRTLIAVDSAGRRELVLEQMAAQGIRPETVQDWQGFITSDSPIAITVAQLEDGFRLTDPAFTVLTERQLFGERIRQRQTRRRAGRDPESIIRDLIDLDLGSPVVHEDYGVGRYLGLQRIDSVGQEAEFLCLQYANEDKLYVPVASLHLISRYTGSDSDSAPLHKLGGTQWDKVRRKAAEKAFDVAAELLDVQARREARQGRAMPLDRGLYDQFSAAFGFEETPDQANAITAVIDDLIAARPMDRVVCGDVGFGKTEVALRAAFVAAQAGTQVAVLVPTTLLAQQHHQNFLDRLADWPIRVEVLSRFRSRAETDGVLKQLADGQVDILIGTHRLLQKDIKFKNLGLLIIDEEQRFGVRQKERIKSLRAEVDMLTLTATPIPRTLNMALAGLRDLSIIATPPAHRMAVKTLVSQWDSGLVRDALQRELQRGGQVFFLHNEVRSIERKADEVERLFPAARVEIAHGQMPERQLERIMLDFNRQRFNVLVCTTIIESGIDIPSANTIIINRADRFGLAQLHQLRGRVGRSHHRAYAYLVVPHPKAMTSDARKRLEALESLNELGAGFTLATHDMEIRGAGELLGEVQSGQIQEVGFSLYMDLLERAVAALKSGKQPALDEPLDHGAEVDLHLAALIPEDYLPDVHARLVLYKRIASAPDSAALKLLQVEMIDRFGLLRQQIKNLFQVTELKLLATPLGIKELHIGSENGRIVFNENPVIDPMTLVRLVQTQPRVYAFDGQQKVRFRFNLPSPEDRIQAAYDLLAQLCAKNAA